MTPTYSMLEFLTYITYALPYSRNLADHSNGILIKN